MQRLTTNSFSCRPPSNVRNGRKSNLQTNTVPPPEVSLFPLFKVLITLGVHDTSMALILPSAAFGLPFATFLIRTHMVAIPRDPHEAANIDGARPFAAFRRIDVPLSPPALASVAFIQIMRMQVRPHRWICSSTARCRSNTRCRRTFCVAVSRPLSMVNGGHHGVLADALGDRRGAC